MFGHQITDFLPVIKQNYKLHPEWHLIQEAKKIGQGWGEVGSLYEEAANYTKLADSLINGTKLE